MLKVNRPRLEEIMAILMGAAIAYLLIRAFLPFAWTVWP